MAVAFLRVKLYGAVDRTVYGWLMRMHIVAAVKTHIRKDFEGDEKGTTVEVTRRGSQKRLEQDTSLVAHGVVSSHSASFSLSTEVSVLPFLQPPELLVDIVLQV